jgi:hypothetical protein
MLRLNPLAHNFLSQRFAHAKSLQNWAEFRSLKSRSSTSKTHREVLYKAFQRSSQNFLGYAE